MNKQVLSLLFYIRKNRIGKDGKAPITLRITLNGIQTEMSSGRKVDPKNWDQKKEKATSRLREDIELNQYLESMRVRVYNFQRKAEDDGRYYDIQSIGNHLEGKDVEFVKEYTNGNGKYELSLDNHIITNQHITIFQRN